jgi:hypothetical protein
MSRALLGLVAVGATLTPLVLVGFGDDEVAVTRPEAEMVPVEVGGVHMVIPDGWYWRSDFIAGFPRKALQAATFPPPPLTHESPSAADLLGKDDVRIVIVEYLWGCPGGDFASLEPPVTLMPQAFEAPHDVCHPLPSLREIPVDHSLARLTFKLDGRLFDLRAEFGSTPVPDRLLSEANDILGSLSVGRYREVPDGLCREEVGFGDPDCPEPQWLGRLLKQAGYELVPDTGESVFVARGAGTEFFVYAEELGKDHSYKLSELPFPNRETVDGVRVYGGEIEWRWRVQGVELQVAEGPYGDSVFPSFEQIEPLVKASIEIPYQN